MEEHFIEINGFKLRYQVEGTGRPTIVIGSSIFYPRTFSKNLRKHLRLIFLDHRGFVKAPKSLDNSAYDLDIILDDIEHVRKKLGYKEVIILGHSGHGFMALEYAKKYPNNVSQVVLIGMGPDQSQKSHKAAEQYFDENASPERKNYLKSNMQSLQAEIEADPERRFITFCLRNGARSWYDYKYDAAPLWIGVNVNMQMIDYVWGHVFHNIEITKGLATFDIPVFLGLGKYDFLVAPPSTWNPIRSKFKNLTIKIFEKSGHTPQLEEPELFDQELLNWITNS